jgi:DNA-binding NarL/FixJ family response regulator
MVTSLLEGLLLRGYLPLFSRNFDDLGALAAAYPPSLALIQVSEAKPEALAPLIFCQQQHPASCLVALASPELRAELASQTLLRLHGVMPANAPVNELLTALPPANPLATNRISVAPDAPMAPTIPASLLAQAAKLTARQVQILRLITQGLTNPDLAEALCISIHTVNNHKTALVNLLGLKSAQELPRTAVQLLPALK